MSTPSPRSSSGNQDEEAKVERTSAQFRFKKKKKKETRDPKSLGGSASKRYRSERDPQKHRRSKRRKLSSHLGDDPSAYDDSTSNLPPDVAFRESLFDALGDDEGAAFWEGVYGQPIHRYPNSRENPQTGELEQMDDEEYAQYVRRKMWERSWEGVEAAKEEQRRQREEAKRQRHKEESVRPEKHSSASSAGAEDFVFDFEIEASLRRGAQRKEQRYWISLWENYQRKWEELKTFQGQRSKSSGDPEQVFLRNKIAWPVKSGKRADVSTEEVQKFVKTCATYLDAAADQKGTLTSILKQERVKWHPDKIQQRYGSMDVDAGTMQGVTAVFQVFDDMWNDLRSTISR